MCSQIDRLYDNCPTLRNAILTKRRRMQQPSHPDHTSQRDLQLPLFPCAVRAAVRMPIQSKASARRLVVPAIAVPFLACRVPERDIVLI